MKSRKIRFSGRDMLLDVMDRFWPWVVLDDQRAEVRSKEILHETNYSSPRRLRSLFLRLSRGRIESQRSSGADLDRLHFP